MELGPLTTQYKPAPGCLSSVYGWKYTDDKGSTHKRHVLGLLSTTQCYPPRYTTALDAFYSPGVCPLGWTSACGSTKDIEKMTETHAVCCPSGYLCVAATESHQFSTLSCSRLELSMYPLIVPQVIESQTIYQQTALESMIIEANPVRIRWKDGDFASASVTTHSHDSSSSTLTSSPSRPTSSGSLPISTSAGSPGDTGWSTTARSGLSRGATAGIGVGIAAGILGFAIILLLVVKRIRKRNVSNSISELEGDATSTLRKARLAEMDNQTTICEADISKHYIATGEVHGSDKWAYELHGTHRAHELQDNSTFKPHRELP